VIFDVAGFMTAAYHCRLTVTFMMNFFAVRQAAKTADVVERPNALPELISVSVSYLLSRDGHFF